MESAHLFMMGRGWQKAVEAWDAALKALESSYADPRVLDDTGLKLLAAEALQKEGQWEKSAKMKRRLLLERLKLHGQKQGRPQSQ